MCLILCGQSIGCLSVFHVNVKLIWPCQERRWLPQPHPYRSVAMVAAIFWRAKGRRLRQMSNERSASPIMFTGLSAGLIMGCLIKTTAFGGGSDKVTVDWRWHPVSLAVSLAMTSAVLPNGNSWPLNSTSNRKDDKLYFPELGLCLIGTNHWCEIHFCLI